MDDILPGVREQLLAEALEVAVDQRQRAAGGVTQREFPGQKAALDRRELALAQVEVVLALPQVPPASGSDDNVTSASRLCLLYAALTATLYAAY